MATIQNFEDLKVWQKANNKNDNVLIVYPGNCELKGIKFKVREKISK